MLIGDNSELVNVQVRPDSAHLKAPTRIDKITTTDTANGANGSSNDLIEGNEDDDVIIGGAGDDTLDGGLGDDLIIGDNAVLASRDEGVTTNARFRVLSGAQIYSATGEVLVAGAAAASAQANWQNIPGGSPKWSNWLITLDDGLASVYGNEYIAGGAGNDTLFGQRGSDVIQGDGSIYLQPGRLVYSSDSPQSAASDNPQTG